VNPKSYEGWSGPLDACEADARDMQAIANHCGYKSKLLLTKQATRDAVRAAVADAAKALKLGDIFLLSNSSHGGQVPDMNGDEDDGQDETWCLYDGELIDDEIYALLGKFVKGVRVFVLSDSCHSGTVTKFMPLHLAAAPVMQGAPRLMPPDVAHRVYLAHKKFYDDIGRAKENINSEERVKGSVLLISGCQDNQTSSDGEYNGLFTGTLKKVWNGGKFDGDYHSFHKTIVSKMPSNQTPNLFHVGALDKAFEGQHPFEI
jgi:hypothetical protein